MTSLEQQLTAALIETPHETDCSVSVAVLNGLGVIDERLQAVWLNARRATSRGKSWQRIDERWMYAETPIVPTAEQTPASKPASLGWRTQTKPERLIAPIVVKPVLPLPDLK